MNELKAKQLNKAIQKLIQSTELSESEMMEYSEIYTTFDKLVEKGKLIDIGQIFRYGVNSLGDSQLYQALQPIVPSDEFLPDVSVSLYKKIGMSESGTPIWTQPLGSTDAYMIGDKVEFEGSIYISIVDNNIWSPDVYGWEAE